MCFIYNYMHKEFVLICTYFSCLYIFKPYHSKNNLNQCRVGWTAGHRAYPSFKTGSQSLLLFRITQGVLNTSNAKAATLFSEISGTVTQT